MWVKQKNKHTSPTAAEQGPRLICSANSKAPAQGIPLPPPAGASFFGEFLTSDNNLSLILRRLDEIERKLDDVLQELRMMQELQTPTAIGYSARRGNLPRKDN